MPFRRNVELFKLSRGKPAVVIANVGDVRHLAHNAESQTVRSKMRLLFRSWPPQPLIDAFVASA